MSERPPARENWPHDVPSAAELVAAVRTYLGDDLGPRSEGRDRFLLRVAANALAIAEREISALPEDAAAHDAMLASFDVASEADLSAAIRAGTLDDRRADLAESLWATTLAKLAVTNPGYRDESLE